MLQSDIVFMDEQFVVFAALISVAAAAQQYPKPPYPAPAAYPALDAYPTPAAYPAPAYNKPSHDYVSRFYLFDYNYLS